MRFPVVHAEFSSYQVLEFSTVFPDIPPKINSLYVLKIRTHSVQGKVVPKLTLVGTESDSGQRSLGEKGIAVGTEMFDIEAVNLGSLVEVEVEFEGDVKASWKFDITVTQTDIGKDLSTVSTTLKKPGKKKRIALADL